MKCPKCGSENVSRYSNNGVDCERCGHMGRADDFAAKEQPHARKDPLSDREYFTLVFKGDITKIKDNPMKIKTPYGLPIASGMGNAFDVIENIHEIEDAAQKLIAAISRYDNS